MDDSNGKKKGYNAFCSENADNRDCLHGKAIPYLGWFWRGIDFKGPPIPIGEARLKEGAPFVGFMANNKWGYPERCLTEDERLQVIAYLDKAMESEGEGRNAALVELWDYMQTLGTETTDGWGDAWYDDD